MESYGLEEVDLVREQRKGIGNGRYRITRYLKSPAPRGLKKF